MTELETINYSHLFLREMKSWDEWSEYLFIYQPLQWVECGTRSFLNEAQQIWIQSFPSLRSVCMPRLKRSNFPTIY